MICAALFLMLIPTIAQADVLICEFTPLDCITCEAFSITINTHHGADTPYFDYDGISASIQQIPKDSALATSYVTLGHADREITTLFNNLDAVHTRHYVNGDTPTADTAIGRCSSF